MAYCTNCGTKVGAGDRFCANCGRATMVRSSPSGVSSAGAEGGVLGPALVMVGILFVMGLSDLAYVTITKAASRPLGFALGFGIGDALATVLSWLVFVLLAIGVYYLANRKKGITILGAFFNWPMVAAAGVIALIALIV